MGLLTILSLFVLFVSSFGFIGPEKFHRGHGPLRYIYIFIYLLIAYLPHSTWRHNLVARLLKNVSHWEIYEMELI